VQNFAFKFQAVAEKTAKNVRGLLYLLPHPVYSELSLLVLTSNAIMQYSE